ncbi:DUF6884 domain-containing protein [Streptomyces sp. NPDC047990]|uniref:DUF6884 domain-containing protein n=1 Tax=Streptomyces sp. NPDC047990 TaxID=3365496 RepID=UPI003720D978
MMITVPGQLRRHVADKLDPKTRGERELKEACRKEVLALVGAGKSFLVTSAFELTNEELGAALDIAREWTTSSNGNNQRAGLSLLKAHELDYEPDDPREIRTEIKAPKSLAEMYQGAAKPATEVLTEDIKRLSWSTGVSGRVRPETLAWLVDRAAYWAGAHPTPSIQRAAKKFRDTHQERNESLQRRITGYLEIEEPEEETEAPASEPKRLILVSCGGKKLDTPSTAAGEMYVGSYHKACRKAADTLGEWVMILSAKYGLVGLDDTIDAYDVRASDPEAITAEELAKQVRDLEIEDAHVTILGGSDYVKLVRQVWPDAEAPLSGGIGEQLHQLATIYKGEALEDDEDQAPEKAGPEITKRRMMDFVQWNDQPTYFHYAGLAKKKATEPRLVYSIWTQSNEGKNLLRDAETHEPIVAVHSSSHIWAAPADPSEIPAPVVEEPEEVEEPEGPENWYATDLRLIGGLPSLHNPVSKVIWYGGQLTKSQQQPRQAWRKVSVSYIGESEYEIWDLATEDTILRCKARTRIAWGYVTEKDDDQEPVEVEVQEAEEPAPVEEAPEPEPVKDPLINLLAETAPPKGGYEVPANFLELAEDGNTEAAKRYWKRRCIEYARTGK